MDLGCLDMGCIEWQTKETSSDKQSSSSSGSSNDSLMATSKIGKNKAMKEAGQSSNLSTLNKCTPQIRKPAHRKTSPLNWIPRKKVDSYLKRKIKLLQEVDGMKSTLDETLGDSNPHYSRVLKEKIAVREAATKAIEARKAAMVEASWCRIIQAARIECKDAEARLLEAEKSAAEAFEAATAIGVVLYDIADCPQKYYKVETSAAKGGGSTSHAVSASFETAFEVDKQVASAVKVALTKFANCSSLNKDECRELLRKISQNPNSDGNPHEFCEFSSECESDTGSEFEAGLHDDGCHSVNYNCKEELSRVRPTKFKKQQASEKFNNLVDIMLERLKGMQEDDLASIATVVATSGLNAVLAEGESLKRHDLDSAADPNSNAVLDTGAGSCRNSSSNQQIRMAEKELPSLDKFLVKRLTRLEREVLEAKNATKNETQDGNQHKVDNFDDKKLCAFDNRNSDFGTMLVKHFSKLEKDIEEAKKNGILFESNTQKLNRGRNSKQDVKELPSLDKFLVKHVSRLEKEVQEAKNRRTIDPVKGGNINENASVTPDTSAEEIPVYCDNDPGGKENIDLNKNEVGEVDLKKRDYSDEDENHGSKEAEICHDNLQISALSGSRIEKQGTRHGPVVDCESLDKILVKHVSKLEKEKLGLYAREGIVMKVKRGETNNNLDKTAEEGLDKLLVKHKSRLQREKMAASRQPEDQIRHSVSRREAREKELQDAWGGLSLGNSIRPHLSRLERDKAAWLKAEEEERMRTMEK